jgi:hypothetical protein
MFYSHVLDTWRLENAQSANTKQRQRPQSQYGSGSAAGGASAAGARPQPSRRGSSWSPPRRSDREVKKAVRDEPALKDSNSRKRATAMVMGALAGGVAGSRFQRKQPVANAVSTVLGAIVGGLGAGEAEQVWDKRRNQKGREQSQKRGGEDRRERRDSRNGRDGRRGRDDSRERRRDGSQGYDS